jgi:hypothetical protein
MRRILAIACSALFLASLGCSSSSTSGSSSGTGPYVPPGGTKDMKGMPDASKMPKDMVPPGGLKGGPPM